MKYLYYCNCSNWPREYVEDLTDCVDKAREITRKTFARNVDPLELQWLEGYIGYCHDFPMAKDMYVRYYSSKLLGRRVYFFNWSAIEFVFTPDGRLSSSS